MRAWKSLVRRGVFGAVAAATYLGLAIPALAQEAPLNPLIIYRLEHLPADSAGEVIAESIQSDAMRLAVEPRTNALIVSAPDELHGQIRALLEAIDRKAEHPINENTQLGPVRVRVIWLASGVQGSPLPKGLEPVAKELEDLGIAELSLAGQMMINVGEPAERFSIESRPRLGEESFDLAFQGGLSTSPSGVPRMTAAIVCSLATGDKIANVASTIETPLDQYIVLGTTVADGSNSVFVLQLTRQPSAKAPAKQ